jgi:hypothetical protein
MLFIWTILSKFLDQAEEVEITYEVDRSDTPFCPAMTVTNKSDVDHIVNVQLANGTVMCAMPRRLLFMNKFGTLKVRSTDAMEVLA